MSISRKSRHRRRPRRRHRRRRRPRHRVPRRGADDHDPDHTYHISVNPGILAGGQNTITANVKVTNPEKSVRDFWSRSTIQQVVRQGVNNGYQMPYKSQGFRCMPMIDGSMNASTENFTCKLRGADVPTTVTLTFAAPYMQSAGS